MTALNPEIREGRLTALDGRLTVLVNTRRLLSERLDDMNRRMRVLQERLVNIEDDRLTRMCAESPP